MCASSLAGDPEHDETTNQGGTMNAKRDVQAHPGDVVVVHGHSTGDPGRTGVIVEVLDRASAHEHYRVRWDEENKTLYWPGSDATVRPGKHARRTPRG
jgi:Domain of unknown function (DUF1918)